MAEEIKNTAVEEQDLNEILRIRREKLAALCEAGENPYEVTKFERTHVATEVLNNYEALEGQEVCMAGRLMSRRIMGKAAFAHVMDGSGQIQMYLKADELGEGFIKFKEYDIGDIVGFTGKVFKTRTGETSVHLTSLSLLSKSLLPLPEKFHGLKDPDLRYRQRYVDLIVNPEVKKAFLTRSKIIQEIRSFLDAEGFMEVETPVLNTISGGASARPFITKHNALDLEMYLRIALELPLKRLIVGGFEKVYEIGRVFRNEGMDVRHNPEFTLMELYQAYTDYEGMMDIVERLYRHVVEKVLGTTTVVYQGKELDFGSPFARITMQDAVKQYLGIDFAETDVEVLKPQLKALGIEFEETDSWGRLLYAAFDQKIEPFLVQPTFVYGYPVEVSPLAKKNKEDKRLTDRFEFFVCSAEMGNAYSELNDPLDQKERFLEQVKAKAAGDEEASMMDEDYINALSYAMPPTGGLGIGIDRMVMLLTDQASIRDVILFPTMKPIKK
ncbi:MAG: lysine--tRNA ligase [Clostridiales bacterium]|nr:lysine--tRNA ligase [Clostridiales bacterium]